MCDSVMVMARDTQPLCLCTVLHHSNVVDLISISAPITTQIEGSCASHAYIKDCQAYFLSIGSCGQ